MSCTDCLHHACTKTRNHPACWFESNLETAERTKVRERYFDPAMRQFIECAADTSSSCYDLQQTRIQEVMHFARGMGYRRIGIAFCSALIEEAEAAARVFAANGFEPVGAICRIESMTRADAQLPLPSTRTQVNEGAAASAKGDSAIAGASVNVNAQEHSKDPSAEASVEASSSAGYVCNSYMQARVLNEAHTDLNVIVGMCVGHDIIVMQETDAPCTTLVSRDWAFNHNPAAGIRALAVALDEG